MDKTFIKDWDLWKCLNCGMLGNTEADECPNCKPISSFDERFDVNFTDPNLAGIVHIKKWFKQELAAILKELYMEKDKYMTYAEARRICGVNDNNVDVEEIRTYHNIEVDHLNLIADEQNKKIEAIAERMGVDIKD